MTERPSNKRDLVQTFLRDRIDPSVVVVRIIAEDDTDTSGLVAYVRDDDFHPFIVHRWATHYDTGRPREDGFMAWSGWYGGDPRAWVKDFERRAGTQWQ